MAGQRATSRPVPRAAGNSRGPRAPAVMRPRNRGKILRVATEQRTPGQRLPATRGVVSHGVRHAADQGNLVHDPGHARQVFAKPQTRDARADGPELTADLSRGVRLWVPGVKLAGAAVVKQQDTRLDPRSPRRWRKGR